MDLDVYGSNLCVELTIKIYKPVGFGDYIGREPYLTNYLSITH